MNNLYFGINYMIFLNNSCLYFLNRAFCQKGVYIKGGFDRLPCMKFELFQLVSAFLIMIMSLFEILIHIPI